MVIICSKCEGLLEVAPNGRKDARVCIAQCGHDFHISCLRDHWEEHRELSTNLDEFKVPCPICGVANRPSSFEIFPSTREVTFIGGPDANDSEAIVALREHFEDISLQRDAAQDELKEKEDRFNDNAKLLHEMQIYRQLMIRERNDVKKEFHDHLMETSKDQKLTSDSKPGGNGNKAKEESIEERYISGGEGSNLPEACCRCTIS